jgi:hypothetical protein
METLAQHFRVIAQKKLPLDEMADYFLFGVYLIPTDVS